MYQNTKGMIVVTGAAGFIGSCMVARLNEAGYKDIVLVVKHIKIAVDVPQLLKIKV